MTTFNELWQQLRAEEHLQTEPDSALLQPQADEDNTPWYINLMIGITAWIAAFFIISFLVAGIAIIESGASFIGMGLLFCSGAIILKWQTPRSIFGGQFALCMVLTGQLLIWGGVGEITNDSETTALVIIISAIVLIILYPDKLHRLLDTLIIIGAVLFLLLNEYQLYEALHAVIISLGILSLLLWRNEIRLLSAPYVRSLVQPIGYGVTLGFLALLIPSELRNYVDFISWWWLSTGGITVLLLTLIGLIFGQQAPQLRNMLMGGVLLLLLPTWQAPGILGSLLILLLGYWQRNRLLMGLAIAFVAFFIGAFYYNLTFDLQQKSLILLASGAICLLLRFGLQQLSPANPKEKEA